MSIKVFIVVGIKIYSRGLAQILDSRPDFDVLGTSGAVATALCEIQRRPPDVVLVDAEVPEACALMEALSTQMPDVRIVGIGVGDDDGAVGRCAASGAAAFVTRDESVERLVSVIRATIHDEFRCSHRMSAQLLRRLGASLRQAQHAPGPLDLTRRQQQILDLIARGRSNKEIARALGIELSTVKNHVHQILERLDVRRRGEAAALWMRTQSPAAGIPLTD